MSERSSASALFRVIVVLVMMILLLKQINPEGADIIIGLLQTILNPEFLMVLALIAVISYILRKRG